MQLLYTIKDYNEYMDRRDEFKKILGFKPEPGSKEEEYHLNNPGTNPNKNEKRSSSMTYCQTIEEFEILCEESIREEGIDLEEFGIYETETREMTEEHLEKIEKLKNPKIETEIIELEEDEW